MTVKIAFILSKAPHYFFYDRVIRLLFSMGHDVRIICRTGFKADGNKSGRALIKLLEDVPQAKFEYALFRRLGARFTIMIRELANYANFLRPGHPMSSKTKWEEIYMQNRLSPKLYRIIKNRIGVAFFSTSFVRWFLRMIEALIPPERQIIDWLKEYQPQVIVVSPYIMTADLEIEYVKAARHLSIPTIASVLSWDNLVSKGTYLVKPEWLFVWNRNLVEEAVHIHEFKRGNVFTTGACVYDSWFDLSPSINRKQFCGQCGVEPENPYLLFLGSSPTITDLDVELIKALIVYFEQMEVDKRPSMIIRPHPYSSFDMTVFENDWVKVFPRQGGRPDIDETRQTYYDTLFHSALVIGVNTTGFLDAAIVDKPCVTLIDGQMSEGQGAHFQYLIDADYIEFAKSRSEFFEIINRILGEVDIKRENRRSFVCQFIRPQGIDIPASQVMANSILAVGCGIKPEDWMGEGHE